MRNKEQTGVILVDCPCTLGQDFKTKVFVAEEFCAEIIPMSELVHGLEDSSGKVPSHYLNRDQHHGCILSFSSSPVDVWVGMFFVMICKTIVQR